ncbi:MAG: ASKHA domain-containing protein [Oryzomonas sp.]|uniref:ASKHA domain-containing protein n=1 Tax=Oryzomonas sp. TaxID=2855186 RepID=UPI002850A079|nr:ASKHA domain-containing protein [Oryzomonas sp.]MDR3579800.1 ASKHA domain-containing protein [Oryzomonas sp.]
MATVHFVPAGRSVSVDQGTTILEASRRAGVLIEAPCNGAGHCGKCTVQIPLDDLPQIVVHVDAPADDSGEGVVLACHSEVYGDITVLVLHRAEEGLRVISAGSGVQAEPDPFIVRRYDATARQTAIWAGDRLLAAEPGDTTGKNYGLVVDVGTTTLVAALVDLANGRELTSASALNPQSLHAQDVLSRIRFAADHDGLSLLQRDLITELNRLAREVSTKAGIDVEEIYEVVFSGNTCMLHLAAGVNPAPLGKNPFTPTLTGNSHVAASALGLAIAPSGLVYLPPVISAYVGADISAGILAAGLAELPGVTLFIDIGTNGELVLAVNGRLTASATAAGPAFEGMNISCGMRAAVGAVERVAIGTTGELDIAVIGAGVPSGICGSGLMDLVSELVEHGIIGNNGRFGTPTGLAAPLAARLVGEGSKAAFSINDTVSLTQKDVRQVQLAKGAIRAGIELLLREEGLEPKHLDRVYIAGSFGYHLREQSLTTLGLLPPEAAGKVMFLGNTARSGGEMLLVDHRLRSGLKTLVDQVRVVDLAGNPAFERVFMEAMGF